MKHFTLLIISFFILSGVQAQGISFDANPVIVSGNTDDWSIDGKFISSNNTDNELSFVWELVRTDVPEEWKFIICDDNLCYAPGFETCVGIGCEPNVFPSSYSTGAMKVTVQPNGTMYDGVVHFNLYDANDSSISYGSLELQFNISGTTSTFEEVEFNTSIYPNPTTNYFQIDSEQDFDQLSVYNILGKEVKSFEYQEGKSYNVSELQSGLYLVRLMDMEGNARQVVRLNKE